MKKIILLAVPFILCVSTGVYAQKKPIMKSTLKTAETPKKQVVYQVFTRLFGNKKYQLSKERQ